MKYTETKIVFREVPNEITLAINISGCPIKCEHCHSKYLWDDIGKPLYMNTIDELVESNKGITCICFMGGDRDTSNINILAEYIKNRYDIKVAWYSGREEISKDIELKNFDYIKLGSYIKEKGPLNNPNTNQRFYEVCLVNELNNKYNLNDITNTFWDGK